MFYPQAMTEIELIVPSKDLLPVAKMLSGRGVFHQVDSAYLGAGKHAGSSNSWQEKASAYAGFERRIQALMVILGVDEGHPTSAELENILDLTVVRPQVEEIEKEVKQITEQISLGIKEQERCESVIRQLKPMAEIDLDVSSLHNSHFMYSELGTVPVANIERLQTSLSRIPFVFLTLSQDNHTAVAWLAGTQNNADILERAARSAYLNPLTLADDLKGTPAEIIQSLQAKIQDLQAQAVTSKAGLVEMAKKYTQSLRSLLWDVRASRMLTDAIVRFGQLRYTYLVVGWIPSDDLEAFKLKLKETSKEAMLEATPARRDEVRQDVPVNLKNIALLRPFQSLVTIYARPMYNEIDPTPIISLLFPLLFGAMFGDVGQGVVLAFLGWLLASKRVKSLRGLAGLGPVIAACGIVATIFGFLYGSFFGFEEVIHPLWMVPSAKENILTILAVAIGFGIVLLLLGYCIGIYNFWRIKDWSRMFFDQHGIITLVLYLSLLGLGATIAFKLPVPPVVFIVLVILGCIGVMFSELFKHLIEGHRPLIEGGIGTYLTMSFFELFETAISLLSNSLSFVRVGAFAVAHGALSGVIFILAGHPTSIGSWVSYVLVLLIGNAFIVGFEGLIVGIQTMRLSYYEFFGKFFRGGGSRYEPLALRAVENK
jgi:V/A-type H+/Na+-transporting ATPase subunit I